HFVHSRPCPPRPLPAFPTRRSSDLVGRVVHLQRRLPSVEVHDVDRVERVNPQLERPAAAQADVAGERDVDVTLHAAAKDVASGLDRKSTRLNSSHVKISYAVFGLNK